MPALAAVLAVGGIALTYREVMTEGRPLIYSEWDGIVLIVLGVATMYLAATRG